MKVLFAVGNEEISESIVKKYQKDYKQIISYKNVYYFNAILKEIQKDKSYDRIVISEELEAFSNAQYDQIDGFIFDKLDSISDEASNSRGEDIPIIVICSDRRNKSEDMLIKMFGIGIYDALIGPDRSVDEICKLINRARSKKEAKNYYQIDARDSSEITSFGGEVSEVEIQNIISYFKKLGNDENKYLQSFNNIVSQYDNSQLRIICKVLPINVRAVLEERSPKYQEVMAFNKRVSDSLREDNSNKLFVEKDLITNNDKTRTLGGPVVIPSSVNMNGNVKLGQKNNSYSGQKLTSNKNGSNLASRNGMNRPGVNRPVANRQPVNRVQENKNNFSNSTEQINTRPNRENFEMKPPRTPKISDDDLGMLLGNDTKDSNDVNGNNGNNGNNIINNHVQENNINDNNNNKAVSKINNSEINNTNIEAEVEKPVKRKRGRPPKPRPPESDVVKPKRKRGRPPKKHTIPDGQEHLDLENFEEETTTLPGSDSLKRAIADSSALGLGINNDYNDNDNDIHDDIHNLNDIEFDDNDDELDVLPGLVDDNEDEEGYDDNNLEEQNNENVLPGLEDFESVDSSEQQNSNEEESFNPMEFFDENEAEEDNQSSSQLNQFESQNFNQYQEQEQYQEQQSDNYGIGSLSEDSYDSSQVGSSYTMNSRSNYGNTNPSASTGNLANDSRMFSPFDDLDTIEKIDLSNLLTPGKKIVSFVGTSKNGTSFIVNNLATLLAKRGVDVAILDTTRNKNSYYIYTENDSDLREVASESITDLSRGEDNGIKVENNLTVYTSIPGEDEDIKYADRNLETLLRNHSLILIDTDFSTPYRYFQQSQETYLVQTQDVLTIQPLTAFLRELKAKNALDEKKLKIILNKVVNVRGVSDKTIIGGMAFYNDPSMSYMTELFDRDLIKYISLPFEEGVFSHYLENIIECKVTLKGFSKNFMQIFNKLGDMVYSPAGASKQAYAPPSVNKFSNDMNNTLEQMRKRY